VRIHLEVTEVPGEEIQKEFDKFTHEQSAKNSGETG
jgi:hypothetical protein